MFLKYNTIIIFLVALLGAIQVHAQQSVHSVAPTQWLEKGISLPAKDSLSLTVDSLSFSKDSLALAKADTLAKDSIRRSPNALDAPVNYQAKDSMVMTAGNMAYLYGEGNVKYQQIELQAEEIIMSLDSR